MFKKILLILLSLGLLIPVLPANAESVGYTRTMGNNLASNHGSLLITEEKALESFRNDFPDQTRGLDFECEYQEWQGNEHPRWSIRIKGYDRGIEYRNNRQQVYVGGSVDAVTGEVIALTYRPSIEYYRERNLSLNREQALALASEQLQKMHPDKVNQLKLNNMQTKSYLFGGFQNCYSFTWKRVSEGIPVDWDSITIGIDAYSGLLAKYNYTWHDMELPKAANILDAKKLMDKLLQEPGLYLSYTRDAYRKSSGLQLCPVYSLNTTANYADAINGKLLDNRGTPLVDEKIRVFKQNFSPADPGMAIKETVVPDRISVNEAMQKAQEFFAQLGYAGEIRQSGSGGGSRYGLRNEYWYFSPKLNPNSELADISVAVDASTGSIREFYSENRYITAPAGEKISPDKALDIALACIKKHHPEKAGSVLENSTMEVYGGPDDRYYFQFARLVNGLPLTSDEISIEIDKFTGKVVSYRIEWYPVQHEPLNTIITEEKAMQLFKDNLSLELVWFQPRNEDYEVIDKPMLAYRLPAYKSLNAFTGEIIQPDYEFKAISTNNMAPATALLYENGLIVDEAIGQAVNRHQALISLMAAANQGYSSDMDSLQLHLEDLEANSEDVRLYRQAVAKKLIPNQGNFNPQASLNREELAIWAIKTLGLNEVGQMKNSIAVPFNDAEKISPGKQNYIGLAYGLGLIKPDINGNINPDQAATWNDLATSVTRIAVMPISY